MKSITNLMIDIYNMKNIDFMGYSFTLKNASFHHLVIPNRRGGPKEIWNGAILNSKTSHPYLHLIETVDYNVFSYITSEMIDMNIKGYLDIDNLRRIHDALEQFEDEHYVDRSKKGKLLINRSYMKRVKL